MTRLRGTTVVRLPELLLLVGPNTGVGHTSIVYMIESQVAVRRSDALRVMAERGLDVVDPRPAVAGGWNAGVHAPARPHRLEHRRLRELVPRRRTAGTPTLWPGSVLQFRAGLRRFDVGEYDVRQRRARGRAGRRAGGRLALRRGRGREPRQAGPRRQGRAGHRRGPRASAPGSRGRWPRAAPGSPSSASSGPSSSTVPPPCGPAAAWWEADVTDQDEMADVAADGPRRVAAGSTSSSRTPASAAAGRSRLADPASYDRVIEVNLLGSRPHGPRGAAAPPRQPRLLPADRVGGRADAGAGDGVVLRQQVRRRGVRARAGRRGAAPRRGRRRRLPVAGWTRTWSAAPTSTPRCGPHAAGCPGR